MFVRRSDTYDTQMAEYARYPLSTWIGNVKQFVKHGFQQIKNVLQDGPKDMDMIETDIETHNSSLCQWLKCDKPLEYELPKEYFTSIICENSMQKPGFFYIFKI